MNGGCPCPIFGRPGVRCMYASMAVEVDGQEIVRIESQLLPPVTGRRLPSFHVVDQIGLLRPAMLSAVAALTKPVGALEDVRSQPLPTPRQIDFCSLCRSGHYEKDDGGRA